MAAKWAIPDGGPPGLGLGLGPGSTVTPGARMPDGLGDPPASLLPASCAISPVPFRLFRSPVANDRFP